ncbi:MAG: hypothetical protein FWE32_11035 [Oscillospiraceae bacterium]|nr:hypothetical protein [Oscillospiraceae bacterium]
MATSFAESQDTLSRVREMQERIRQSADTGPDYRNWSTNPNIRRQTRIRQEEPEPAPPIFTPPRPEPTPAPQPEPVSEPQAEEPPQQEENRRQHRGNTSNRRASRPPPDPPPNPEPSQPQGGGDTTLLQDILGKVGLDDDRVLILGLILILINDKADTTLILALLYLLL